MDARAYEFRERVAILMEENGWTEMQAIAECVEQFRLSAQGLIAQAALDQGGGQ